MPKGKADRIKLPNGMTPEEAIRKAWRAAKPSDNGHKSKDQSKDKKAS